MGRKNHKIKEAKRKAEVKKRGIRTPIPWGKIRLVVVLVWLLGVQVFAFSSPKSEFEKAKERIIKNPQDFEARLVLAEELLRNNRLEEADHELLTALNLQQSNNKQSLISLRENRAIEQSSNNEGQPVLGKQISKLQELTLQKQESDPEDLEVLIQKWQEILEEKPDYRDGWLKLALYLIKVGENSKAQEALKKAKGLDPNHEVIKELEELLGEN